MTDDDYKAARERMCKSRERRKNVSEAETILFEAMGKCVDRGISLAEIEEALRNSIQLVLDPKPEPQPQNPWVQYVTRGYGQDIKAG